MGMEGNKEIKEERIIGILSTNKVAISQLCNFLIKGIYRVNGVKGRIEKICAQMDISPDRVDLTTASHHDVSGVMKYFLRQLPEPLMLFSLYDSFLKIGKVFKYLFLV